MTRKHDDSRYVDILKRDCKRKIRCICPHSVKERYALTRVHKLNEELSEAERERGEWWETRYPATKPHIKTTPAIRPLHTRLCGVARKGVGTEVQLALLVKSSVCLCKNGFLRKASTGAENARRTL